MNELDERLRTGLQAATDSIDTISSDALAEQIDARASATASMARAGAPSHRPLLAVAAVVLLVAGLVGIGLATTLGDRGVDVFADDPPTSVPPTPSDPFEGWAPGWHRIDTTVAQGAHASSMVWHDGLLYLAAAPATADEALATTTPAWSFDPTTKQWSAIADVPFARAELAATSRGLVAIGNVTSSNAVTGSGVAWATWEAGAPTWTSRGEIEQPEFFEDGRSLGPYGPGGKNVISMGDTAVFPAYAAVLDPETGTAAELDMGEGGDLVNRFRSSWIAWTGSRLIGISRDGRPGLAWDSSGELIGDLPKLPFEPSPDGAPIVIGTGDGTGSAVVIGHPGSVASLDEQNRWTLLPTVPDSASTTCWNFPESVAGGIVVEGCIQVDDIAVRHPAQRLLGDAWTELARRPDPTTGQELWLGTSEALFVWASGGVVKGGDMVMTDGTSWLMVWIPEAAG